MPTRDGAAERRRRFRAWVRAHHPDAGGDPEAFAAGLAAWRRGGPVLARTPAPEVTAYRTRSWQRLLRRRRRHLARLPPGP